MALRSAGCFKTELIMDIVLFSCIAAFVAGIVVAAAHILT
jgi:ABC-type phosphate transport system permease subunit